MIQKLLKQIPLFAALESEELAQVQKSLSDVTVAPGETLFNEGEVGDRFYIVVEGQVEVVKAIGSTEERLLGAKGPGGYLGEMSLFEPDGRRTASVRSEGGAHLLEMTRNGFESLLSDHPSIAYEIARALSALLRNADNSAIRDLKAKNRQLSEAYAELQAAQAQIIEKEKLEHELQVAREIQLSILPTELPTMEGYDFGASIVPAKAVGGDFYDFIQLDGDRMGIAIGDVSDKGVPAAIFMAMTRSLMRSEAKIATNPKQALEGVNRHLVEMNNAGMFVTVLYGVLDRRDRSFTYARAGHCLPIAFEDDGEIAMPACTRGQPIGVFDFPEIDEQRMLLPPASTLLLYTDGLTDAENASGQFFGLENLNKALKSATVATAQETCTYLLDTVEAFEAGTPPTDDLTLVVVKSA